LAWENDDRQTLAYDSNENWIEWIDYNWTNSQWVNEQRETQSYNTNDNWLEWISYSWNGSWNNESKDNAAYDENNNLAEWISQQWNSSDWENTDRYLYTYSSTTDADEIPGLITDYSLSNNYPNPFNPSTLIEYQLPKEGFVSLRVYDIAGREVASLVNQHQVPGEYSVNFIANNLASGLYFYHLKANNYSSTRKMMLLK
jgi:hypothetical protein